MIKLKCVANGKTYVGSIYFNGTVVQFCYYDHETDRWHFARLNDENTGTALLIPVED